MNPAVTKQAIITSGGTGPGVRMPLSLQKRGRVKGGTAPQVQQQAVAERPRQGKERRTSAAVLSTYKGRSGSRRFGHVRRMRYLVPRLNQSRP